MKTYEPYSEFRSEPTKIYFQTRSGGKINITVYPGSSFGSRHTTTLLCIRAIEELFINNEIKTVLDIGCGSGVLSLCASALGAQRVLALDIDPLAVKEARANVLKNYFSDRVIVKHGTLEDVKEEFNLVIANIVTVELLRMVHDIRLVLSKNGTLVISGVSELKSKIALDGFSDAGFELVNEYNESGWVAMWLKFS